MISSAPESTSFASTWLRRATGFFRVRHGAPTIWWWSDDDAQRAGRAARSRVVARSSCSSLTPPDWWRHGRTELSPTTCAPRADEHRLGRLPLPLELAPGRA